MVYICSAIDAMILYDYQDFAGNLLQCHKTCTYRELYTPFHNSSFLKLKSTALQVAPIIKTNKFTKHDLTSTNNMIHISHYNAQTLSK